MNAFIEYVSLAFFTVFDFIFNYIPMLLVGVLLFAFHAEKKEKYIVKLIIDSVIFIGISEMLWRTVLSSRTTYTKYLILLVEIFFIFEMLILCRTCFKTRLSECFLYVMGGMIVQHFANTVVTVLVSIFDIPVVYENSSPVVILINACCYLAVYTGSALFLRKIWKNKTEIFNKRIIIPFFVIFFVVNFLNTFKPYNVEKTITLFFCLYDISCCVVALFLCSYAFENGELVHKLDILSELEKKNSEQYETMKDSIDLINTKCHDLKKIVSLLENGGSLSENTLDEINKSLFFYDVAMKTGDKAFDTIVTEKSLLCEKEGVEFIVFSETENLKKIEDFDVYSIFGNILDNAFEATSRMPMGQRMMSLRVRDEGKMISIHSENTFVRKVEFKNGRLKTSKGDADEHGFGMLSIQRAIKKYNGELNISVSDGLFEVDIVIPVN